MPVPQLYIPEQESTISVKSTTIELDNGKRSRAIWASRLSTAKEIIAALEIDLPRALLILNGGTAEPDAILEVQLRNALDDELARLVAHESIAVITGGTDAGIFHLFGQGIAKWGRTAPCIGVAVESLVTWPGKPDGEAPLESNHSHLVLVEGENWGDETETMYALAAELGKNCPSVAVFAGGGEIAIKEMLANVAARPPHDPVSR